MAKITLCNRDILIKPFSTVKQANKYLDSLFNSDNVIHDYVFERGKPPVLGNPDWIIPTFAGVSREEREKKEMYDEMIKAEKFIHREVFCCVKDGKGEIDSTKLYRVEEWQ